MTAASSLRIIRFAFQNFSRNFWLATATISVLVLTLVSVNLLLTMNVLGKAAITTVKSKIDVAVHFKPEVEENRVQTVKIALLALPEVRDVEFISASQSLERFSEAYKKDTKVIESLGEVGSNPFGATLVVKARDLSGYPRVIQTLDDPAFVSLIDEKDFDDRQEMIKRVEAIASRVELSGLVASAFFGLITLLIIFNAIRISIYTRREEIGIMRLVGASNGFIRGPYYVETIVWSVLALALTMALILPAAHLAQPYLQKFFGMGAVDISGFYRINFLRIVGAQLAAVSLLSLLTTKAATARYLRV